MAKIILNPAIQVISGDISGFVYRHQADGSVIIAKAGVRHQDHEPTPAQEAQIQKFKEASARYARLIQEVDVREAYEKVLAAAGPTARMRAMVMGDIMSAPKIDALDLSHYQGRTRDTIRVLAEDNVGVARLELVIFDQTASAVLETAFHQPDDRVRGEMEWVYTTTADAPAGHAIEVQVAAYDLAGNKIEQASAA
jgi:hypothetical protein